ncbi:MAG: signal peptidase I [Bacteroidota bacterium]
MKRFIQWLRRPKSKTAETIESFVVAIGLALIIRATIAEARFIPSESMLPTLQVGDRLLVEKISYHFRMPVRGDIVVFDPPFQSSFGGHNAFIKRIIGTPKDTIEVKDGKVILNGQALPESYIQEAPAYTMAKTTVPDDQFFVMGDNRNNSVDSHIWGFLPKKNIIGRAFVRFWPIPRMGLPG